MRVRAAGAAVVIAASAALLAGCGAGGHELAGVWLADDGSGVKTITEDGSCTGMYYNNGTPLDIGGGMTCTLGESESDGGYMLVVRQPPNEATYVASFTNEDTLVLSDSTGVIVTLTRQ